jgi:GNAT superfamily N-acetyltransferase
MTLPSFDDGWREGQRVKPRILVLEIRDKDRPQAEALGWLLVEREETYQRDSQGTIDKASIRLSYQRILSRFSRWGDDKGQFHGGYLRYFDAVSLTSTSAVSKGAVFLNLPGLYGQRIGTYLMNEIVHWARQWPEASVHCIELLAEQAHDDQKKARRNGFYEQFGIVFDYADPERRAGRSRPMRAGALTPVETWRQNIVEHRMFDYLAEVLYAGERATSEWQLRERAFAEWIAEWKEAEARPVRWAWRQLYCRYAHKAFVGLVLFLMVVMAANEWSGTSSPIRLLRPDHTGLAQQPAPPPGPDGFPP